KSKPKSVSTAKADAKKNASADGPSKEITAAKPLENPELESTTASLFSATNSSRRSAIQKRELAQEAPAPAIPNFDLPPSSPPPVTPHWTPKFAEQAACLQLPDDE